MAQRAVELVAERLKANGLAPPAPVIEYLPFTLIERGTTAPPPATA
jgi:DNA-binding LacI/PurR family transcriptional regulator